MFWSNNSNLDIDLEMGVLWLINVYVPVTPTCKLQLFENHQLVTDVNFCKAMILIKFSDHRGLEVCCSGAGSSVSLDLHSGGASGHSGNYFPGMIKQLH